MEAVRCWLSAMDDSCPVISMLKSCGNDRTQRCMFSVSWLLSMFAVVCMGEWTRMEGICCAITGREPIPSGRVRRVSAMLILVEE